MSTFHFTPEADADLDEITDYYRDKSPKAGRRLLDAIELRFRLLAAHPRMGTPRGDLGSDVRTSPVRPYVIYFRPADDGVVILRVIHGSRDIDPSMFEG
jgi:toxin ParE1/3/4